MPDSAILRTQSLGKRFGGIIALDDVNFAVPKGSITGLIGPNGAGKTTLFNTITGFDPATCGHIFFKEQDITQLPAHQLSRLGMARTFQHIRLFKEMTALENVMLGRHHTRTGQKKSLRHQLWHSLRHMLLEEKEIRLAAQKWLSFLELERYGPLMARNLPYGKQKELEIARALATGPELLFLDEPAAGMNPSETRELMSVIKKIQSQGITLVLIEHDMNLIMSICDQITVLNHGKKIADGPAEQIRNNPIVIQAYLGDGE